MKFYVLTQKQDVGCPLGMLNGVLVDGFDPDVHKTNYGLQPWYANPARGLPHEPFPETLCFVTKDRSMHSPSEAKFRSSTLRARR